MTNVNDGTSKRSLEGFGGTKTLYAKLQTSLKGGIENTEGSKKLREEYFGSNALIEPPSKSLWEIFVGCFEDETLRLLIIAAIASLIIGIITEGWAKGWYESVAILVAVMIVVTITTINDYSQEEQFRQLFRKSQNRVVKVVREGKLIEIDSQQLLAGDIFEINTGLIVPADALLVERHGRLKV